MACPRQSIVEGAHVLTDLSQLLGVVFLEAPLYCGIIDIIQSLISAHKRISQIILLQIGFCWCNTVIRAEVRILQVPLFLTSNEVPWHRTLTLPSAAIDSIAFCLTTGGSIIINITAVESYATLPPMDCLIESEFDALPFTYQAGHHCLHCLEQVSVRWEIIMSETGAKKCARLEAADGWRLLFQ